MELEPRVSAALSNLLNNIGSAVELHYVVGPDASGDTALWIWVVMADAAAPAWTFAKRKALRETIASTLWKFGWPHPVYVRFRAESDPSSGLGEVPFSGGS